MEPNFTEYKFAPPNLKPNKLEIPITEFLWNEEGVAKFNEIYRWCLELEEVGDMQRFQSTERGTIRKQYKYNAGARFRVWESTSRIELILSHPDTGRLYRFRMVHKNHEVGKGQISGTTAFKLFDKEVKATGVNLENFAVDNGLEYKEQIPKPKIKFNCLKGLNRVYENVHHIDLNSAYVAGIAEKYPALEPAIQNVYKQRKTAGTAIFKNILTHTTGYFQSEWIGYKYSNLALAAHLYTHRTLDDLAEKIEDNGGTVLGFNTDGIWYQGDVYHDENEGTQLGQWKNDYINCKLRVKSNGAYEFIDNENKYHVVYRGQTTLDAQKDREDWVWGDIFQASEIKWVYVEGQGIFKKETELC